MLAAPREWRALFCLSAWALSAGGAGAADDDPDAALRKIVEEQAAQIAELQTRLAALERAASPEDRPALAGPESAQAPARPTPPAPPITVNWDKPVPEFISPDRDFRFRPKARLVLDAATTTGSNHAARNISGTELRALRLGVEGGLGPEMFYVLEADFSDNNATVRGAYFGWRDRWRGADVELSLGNRLSERSIEGSISSDATPFMERNAVASAITPLKGFYGLGVIGKVYGASWHLAAEVAGDDVGNTGDARDTLTYMARGHWTPVKSKDAVLHLGGWGFYEDYPADLAATSRNSLWAGHFNDNLQIPLGALREPDHGVGYGFELGGVHGSRWAFVEAGRREIDTRSDHVEIDALAFSAGWLLTGELAPYAARSGTFARLRPNAPLSDGGRGAVELALRYQRLDNRDAPLGGKGDEVTLGVNWWAEDWLRVMLNISVWEIEHASGPFAGPDEGASLASRLQLSF